MPSCAVENAQDVGFEEPAVKSCDSRGSFLDVYTRGSEMVCVQACLAPFFGVSG